MQCTFQKYNLYFKKPGGTSRGVLYDKTTYFIVLHDGEKKAFGECNLFKNLSFDDRPNYESKLKEICRRLPSERQDLLSELSEWPSIKFGVETVLKDWENNCRQIIFPESIKDNGFSVPINGLIWMGTTSFMKKQIDAKIKQAFTCIKLKIGAIDFTSELALLKYVRQRYRKNDLDLRVDANGAWTFAEAREKLKRLSEFGISYIEQPIAAGQWQEMAALAETSPIKIALDEELIGMVQPEQKIKLVETIKPQILILKPALIGGFRACDFWKALIQKHSGGWVLTSALESNIGLNAIAQYTALSETRMAQGLGTGQLFTNNIPSPYSTDAKGLHYHINQTWDFSGLL